MGPIVGESNNAANLWIFSLRNRALFGLVSFFLNFLFASEVLTCCFPFRMEPRYLRRRKKVQSLQCLGRLNVTTVEQ